MQLRVISAIAAGVVLATTSAALAVPEVCGNGIDDNGNGYADEGCFSNRVMGVCENPLSCKITGDVAPKTGAFVYQLPADIDPTVAFGPKLQFKRTYMSMYAPPATNYRTAMGARWQHNWESWLDKSGSTVVVHMPTGQDVLYSLSVSGLGGYDYYVPQAGVHVTTPPNGTGAYLRQATASPNNWELRTLTGEKYVFNWASPVGKLIEIDDTMATPNKVTIAYNTSGSDLGQINTITDAAGHKRLVFAYTSGLLTTVNYQTGSGSTWTTRVALTFVYTGTNPTTVKIAGTTIQTNAYTSNYLTSIQDASANHVVDVNYVGATPGMVANITTGDGGIGYEYNSANTQCTGKTELYFNIANATACSTDTDCGSTFKCGGKTGTGATGKCYRAARCLTTASPSEDLITNVTAITPCTGACAPTAQYAWNTTTLDLNGIELADGNWTSYSHDANGMVTTRVDGDNDSDATNAGGAKTWFFYGDSNFPGLVTEIRTPSNVQDDVKNICDNGSNVGGCKRTQISWESSDHLTDGLLHTKEEDGFAYGVTNTLVGFANVTTYAYNAKGQLTQVDGPLSGSTDVTNYAYWTSSDVFKDGYLNTVQRQTDATHALTTTLDSYDYFGNAGSMAVPDGTFTCRTWDGNRNYLSQVREAMAGQLSCTTVNGADLTTSFVRDSWLRLTKTTRPLGDCQHKEYDASGRLTNVKLRDDCVSTNTGDTQVMYYDANGLANKLERQTPTGTVAFRTAGGFLDGTQLDYIQNTVNPSYQTSLTWYSDGQVDTVTSPNSLGKTEKFWDAQNRETDRRRYTDAVTFNLWHFTFHFSGQTTSKEFEMVTDPASKSVTTSTDDLGRTNRVVSPDSGTTLYVYDAASRMTTVVEGYGAIGQVTHTFSYDGADRKLTEDYDDNLDDCTDGTGHVTEVNYSYDQAPVSCPVGASCTRQTGRLAYVKEKMYCDSTQPDKTLDQETFYAYDDSGRLVQEYIRDDSGRTATQAYAWDKNGNLTQVTAPSTASELYTRGGSGNSDTNLVATVARSLSGTTTNLLTNILYAPIGPVTQYDQANTIGGSALRATLAWNLAYRASSIDYSTVDALNHKTHIAYAEDEKGRYTQKLYTNVSSGVQSDYLQYDWYDRPTCDSAVSGTCPTSGTNLKTNVAAVGGGAGTGYNTSNDRASFYHQDPLYGGAFQYGVTEASGKDQISTVQQSGKTSAISYGWDARGDRTYEDDANTANDRRDYTYDGRRRVHTITGLTPRCNPLTHVCTWQTYVITYAYDHRDRLIFRSYHNVTAGFTSQTYYYYDLTDRLIETKFLPTSDPATYTVYDFYWLRNRPVAYWAVDQLGTTARYFMHADESNRVIEVYDWPSTGDASDVWSLNPEVFGWDTVVNGSIYQPLRLNNALYDDGTMSLSSVNPTVADRPFLLFQNGVHFDPMTETFLQQVSRFEQEPYALSAHSPSQGLRIVSQYPLPRMMTNDPKTQCYADADCAQVGLGGGGSPGGGDGGVATGMMPDFTNTSDGLSMGINECRVVDKQACAQCLNWCKSQWFSGAVLCGTINVPFLCGPTDILGLTPVGLFNTCWEGCASDCACKPL